MIFGMTLTDELAARLAADVDQPLACENFRSQLSRACRAVAPGSPKPCAGGLAKEGEKLGNPTDVQLLQTTFDRMK
jgi:hypothetical protein